MGAGLSWPFEVVASGLETRARDCNKTGRAVLYEGWNAILKRVVGAKGGFEGWYFKHQRGDDTVAFIPGLADTGAFVQVISPAGSKQFDVPSLSVEGGVIRAGNCRFSPSGCTLELPGIHGHIDYGRLTPLESDIMGPFRYLPMQCRHGVISMEHTLSGGVTLDGRQHDFDGGKGYLEKDSGTSFPRSYLWLQCNDFDQPCALMVSIAHIPFCGASFTGCICALLYGGREYRLATYRGVRIHAAGPKHVCLSQSGLLLEIEITPFGGGHPLRSPVRGSMSGIVRECCNADIRVRLWEGKRLVIDLYSGHGMYEFVPPMDRN